MLRRCWQPMAGGGAGEQRGARRECRMPGRCRHADRAEDALRPAPRRQFRTPARSHAAVQSGAERACAARRARAAPPLSPARARRRGRDHRRVADRAASAWWNWAPRLELRGARQVRRRDRQPEDVVRGAAETDDFVTIRAVPTATQANRHAGAAPAVVQAADRVDGAIDDTDSATDPNVRKQHSDAALARSPHSVRASTRRRR